MAYTTAHSFALQPAAGGTSTDFATLGVTVIGGDAPFIPEPLTRTVNVPGMVGGYTYVNKAQPTQWVMRVVLDAEDADYTELYQALDAFEDATDPENTYRLYLDGVTDRYWKVRRISGVPAEAIGQRAIEFDIVWQLDDPYPVAVSPGT